MRNHLNLLLSSLKVFCITLQLYLKNQYSVFIS